MSNIVNISKAKKKSKSHVGFLGSLLVGAIFCFLLLSPIFSIVNIEVVGNDIISENYIISSSGILYGENILRMNKFDAIEKINSVPAIKSTDIRRNWPDEVIITIEEKETIAEVKFYGSKLLISENGDVVKIITDNEETKLPILEGLTIRDVKAGENLICDENERLEKYLEVLKKLKENDMLGEVINLSDKDGILVSFNIGHVVFFGDMDNLQHKIDWLKGILGKEENPAYIDLHNLDKVVTKPVWGMFEDSPVSNDNMLEDNLEEIRGDEGEE